MNDEDTYWFPKTSGSEPLVVVLNRGNQPMTPARHRSLMIDKLERLIDESGSAEVKRILENHPIIPVITDPEYWAIAIMDSDAMMIALNNVDWDESACEEDLKCAEDMYEEQCFWSFIESL